MSSADIKNSLKRAGSTLVMLVFSLVVIAVGELLPPLRAVDRVLAANPPLSQALIALTAGMTAAGVILLVFTQFLVRVPDPRRDQSAAATISGSNSSRSARFFHGITAGAGFQDEARVWQLKRAFQNGDWWRKPRWRRFTLMALGAALLLYGMTGLFFIIFPPGIKLLFALAAGYATVRIAWAFKQDRSFREIKGEGEGEEEHQG